jgi:hypothetical protein
MNPRAFLSTRSSLLLSVPVLLVFAVAVWQMVMFSPPYPLRAKLFPLLVAVPMLVIALYQVAVEIMGSRRTATAARTQESAAETATASAADLRQGLLWFAAFFAGLWALGFLVAVPLFTFSYFVLAGGDRWYWGLLGAVVSIVLLWGMFDQWLHIPLLHGAIFTALGFA